MLSYKEQILSYLHIPEKGSLLVAFSGGSDSLALLSLLPASRTRALYVNHRLRSRQELEKELMLNRENARRLSIPLEIVELDEKEVENLALQEKIGLEAAARKLRYRILFSSDADYILTAHHQDDQCETFIMRILDGSPVHRLEGIREREGRLVRPLLSCPKSLINSYLIEAGLVYSEDSTNLDTQYRRNSLRHGMLKLLSQEQKDLITAITSNLSVFRGRLPVIPVSGNGLWCSIKLSEYVLANDLTRLETLYEVLGYLGLKGRVKREELEMVDRAIRSGKRRLESSFCFGVRAGRLCFYPQLPFFLYAFERLEDFTCPFFSVSVSREGDSKSLRIDTGKLSPPILLRLSEEGDEIELKDGRKKIRSLEKEVSVPYSLVMEDRNGIRAVFMRFLGSKDRISASLRGTGGQCIIVNSTNKVLL